MKLTYNVQLAASIRRTRKELASMERHFSDDAMRQSGLQAGQLMRHHGGLTYRLEEIAAKPDDHHSASAVAVCRRVYKSGRTPAATCSYFSLSELEPIRDEGLGRTPVVPAL